MLANYLKTAIRSLLRYKLFSSINILGLAIAMSICMGIMMLVADQLRYDLHNTKRDRVYRIVTHAVDEKGAERNSMTNATSPMTLREELMENNTEIEQVVRFKRGFGNNWMELVAQNVNIPLRGYFADPEVFDVFEYEFEYGDAASALVSPYSVVLTRKAADKLFEEKNPLGSTIKVGEIGTYTVTGVLRETTNKSHISFEALASISTIPSLRAQGTFSDTGLDDWTDFWAGWTYVVRKEARTKEDLESLLQKVFENRIMSITRPEVYKANLKLQPLMNITPGDLVNNPIGPSMPWLFVYFLSGLAGVILLTSCFNFTNLSIARSLTRAREIGVRKVTGAARWQIFIQFLSESVVVSLVALGLAFLLLGLVKPMILQLTFARVFKWGMEINTLLVGMFVLFAILVGILGGLFPAIVLSGFKATTVLKKVQIKVFSRVGLRKFLLISQFSLSLLFIISAIVMNDQLQMFMHKDLGFGTKDKISIRLNNTSAQALKTELLRHANIDNVAAASHLPASGTTHGNGYKRELADPEWTGLNFFMVDEDYVANMEVAIVAGNYFSAKQGEANRNFIVLNRQAVQALGFETPLQAVGEVLIYEADLTNRTIIGVVEDYDHTALMEKNAPMALVYDPDKFSLLQVKYSGSHAQAVVTIEKAWTTVNPGLKADYKDFETEIRSFYETIFGDFIKIIGFIASLAIFISCLGLLAMATYSTETRMKEVCIRKVLGCSNRALVLELSRGFLSILLIAILIAVPVAYFLNTYWLELMAYHVAVGGTSIGLGILLLVIFGVITIGSQTWRATFVNPVDNLKSE